MADALQLYRRLLICFSVIIVFATMHNTAEEFIFLGGISLFIAYQLLTPYIENASVKPFSRVVSFFT